MQSLVEKIPDDILEQTRVRKKKVAFKEEAENLGLDQESGEWSTSTEEKDTEEEKLSGSVKYGMKIRKRAAYNLDEQEEQGGEELEKIAVSRKLFRELSCNSNVRTNLVPEEDRKIMKRIVCVKLKDDIQSPGEMNGQIMALKEHVKARYRLSDLIRAQKNDKMTSNLSQWNRTGTKEKGHLKEDSYKILSQFYNEKKNYSTTQLMGW